MFWQQIVNGLAQGSIYSLVGIGFALIFGVLGLVHFAHGDVYMLGAFFGVNWALLQAAGDAWTGRFEARWKRGGEPGPQDRLSP